MPEFLSDIFTQLENVLRYSLLCLHKQDLHKALIYLTRDSVKSAVLLLLLERKKWFSPCGEQVLRFFTTAL